VCLGFKLATRQGGYGKNVWKREGFASVAETQLKLIRVFFIKEIS